MNVTRSGPGATDASPRVKVTLDEGARLPEYKTPGAAGMDIYSAEPVELQPMQRRMVRTGLSVAIPAGYEGQMRPRSGLAHKHGLTMVNTPGTIDSDYRGEIRVILINLGQETVRLEAGERIAQLVVVPVCQAVLEVVDSLDDTERGTGGFGSTGTK
ncbi:MAG TPA: dUTP diphosphatase [Fimbriimonadaceae bacterium]|nr:dUTP diphosphatase [Fimbriimonadaceae bacterium]